MRYEDRYYHTRTANGDPCPLSAKAWADRLYENICTTLAAQYDDTPAETLSTKAYISINSSYIIDTPVKVELSNDRNYILARYKPGTDEVALVTSFPIGFGLAMYKRDKIPAVVQNYTKAQDELFKAIEETLNKYAVVKKYDRGYEFPPHLNRIGIEIQRREDMTPGLLGEPRLGVQLTAWWKDTKPDDPRDPFVRHTIDVQSLSETQESILRYVAEVHRNHERHRKHEEAEREKWNIEREHKDLIRLMTKYPDIAKGIADGKTAED